jgi:hypothetical protein
MEWRSLEHVSVAESYMQPGGVYDYLHANSIDLAPDGHLLVSGRHTWALYKLDRRTGAVLWRLGGKRTDFTLGAGARFAWQHDAAQASAGRITVFDNGAAVFGGGHPGRKHESQSRALVLDVHEGRRTVELARAYHHHPPVLTVGYGSVQTLPDGDVVIGWGNVPSFTHLKAGGAVLDEVTLPVAYSSYRAFRQSWSGKPNDRPALAGLRAGAGRASTLYVSWNGATEVAAWELSAGPSAGRLHPVARSRRTGFETEIRISATHGYAAATALDRAGHPLGTSEAIRL